MTFKEWWNKDLDENEEWLYDASGGDWEDLLAALEKVYDAGYDAGFEEADESSMPF